VGAASAIDKSTPYYAWRTIFKQIFNWSDLPDDPAAQRDQILAQLETEFGPAAKAELIQLAPLLNAVLPLEWPDNELTEHMTGKVRADNTNELLRRLLEHAARKGYAAGSPCLVILEDTHWLDSASWGLTLLVAQQVNPLLLVIATRPFSDPLPVEYSQFLHLPQAYKLALSNLSPREAVTLVCHRLGVAELPPALAELIYKKAQGNPFFSEELVYALRDAGLISVQDGKCEILPEAGDLKNLSLPDTIQGVITSRIDPLPPAQQLTLKVASVIGRVFAFNTLRDVYPIDNDKAHLPEYLNKLGVLDITQLELPDPELTYIFKHIITQEVAYNMMLFAQRRDLHRAVAEWYETSHA
jgi:predicted ATPase